MRSNQDRFYSKISIENNENLCWIWRAGKQEEKSKDLQN